MESSIGNRIKLLIDAVGINKSELARQLKMSPASVSKICKGINNPSEQTIMVICQKFNINEKWLRTGQGEMFAESADEDIIEKVAAGHGLSPEFSVIVKRLLQLPPDVQEKIVDAVFAVAEQLQSENPSQRAARLLREEADAVEQGGGVSSALPFTDDTESDCG